MTRETCPVRRAINAYNQAETALWRAKERQEQAKARLIDLLQDYPATTDDPVIQHHILHTEVRTLSDGERLVICGGPTDG